MAQQPSFQLHSTPDRSQARHNNVHRNVDWPERYASLAFGINMIYGGMKDIFNSPARNFLTTMAGGYLVYRGLTGNCPLYTSWGKNGTNPLNINIKTAFIVDRPRQEVFDFWRQLENLPRFMSHLKQVTELDDKRSHWEATLPGNVGTVKWDAEIVKEEDSFLIGWHSIPNSMIENAGKVEFFDAPNGRTELRVVISYRPPAGALGAGVAKLFNPLFRKMVQDDVNNFKHYIEKQPKASSTTVDLGDSSLVEQEGSLKNSN